MHEDRGLTSKSKERLDELVKLTSRVAVGSADGQYGPISRGGRGRFRRPGGVNPIERLNGEIKRRTEVVGIFPNDGAIVRLVGALLLEQNDEWAVQRARYMTLVWMPAVMQGDFEPLNV